MVIQGPKRCFHTRKKNSLRCIRKRSTKGGTTARLLWETMYLLLPNPWRPSLIGIGVLFLHKSCSLWAQLSGPIFILFFGRLSFKIWPKQWWTLASLPCGHPQSLLFFPHSQSPSMTLPPSWALATLVKVHFIKIWGHSKKSLPRMGQAFISSFILVNNYSLLRKPL